MSAAHEGTFIQKSIGELAEYIQKVLPAQIPEYYPIASSYKALGDEESIRQGVAGFRDFLFLLCDCLQSHGLLFDKPRKNTKIKSDYPLLFHTECLLLDMGLHGCLNGDGTALTVKRLPSFTPSVDENGGARKAKAPLSKLGDCLRFLTLCGFVFESADSDAKQPAVSDARPLVAVYPGDPRLLTGLKAMAMAEAAPKGDRWRNGPRISDVFLRCDYRALADGDETGPEPLRDYIRPLSRPVQTFVLERHQRAIDLGLTHLPFLSLFDMHYIYVNKAKHRRALTAAQLYQKRIMEFALSAKHGHCLVVRAKHTDRLQDELPGFHPLLRDTIERGYGCDRKLRNEPCQGGCQGIRLPLDDVSMDMIPDLNLWLDTEMRC